jgi:hypothetical protein
VITEATLRLVSRPEVCHGFECRFDDWASAATRSRALAEACRPWLTRLLLVPDEANGIRLQGVFSGRSQAVDALMKAHDLQECSENDLIALNTRVAGFWEPGVTAHQEHAFPLGALEAMGDVIANLGSDASWLAWPESGWLICQSKASPGPSSA